MWKWYIILVFFAIAYSQNTADFSSEYIDELKESFTRYDQDKDGILTMEEILAAIAEEADLDELDRSAEEITKAFSSLVKKHDIDGDSLTNLE